MILCQLFWSNYFLLLCLTNLTLQWKEMKSIRGKEEERIGTTYVEHIENSKYNCFTNITFACNE